MSEKVYRSELTPVSFLRRAAYMFPDHTAIVHGDRRYTYREFEERVNRLASRLREADLEKGDRVAFLCPNIPPMLEAHFALPAAGIVLVAINTRLSADEVAYILEHSQSKMLFADHELEHLADSVDIEKVRIDDTGEAGDPYEDYLAQGSPKTVESWLEDEEETISVNYTSGTTGRPKGVMYTHRGAYLCALGNVIEAGMDYSTKYLWTLPMFHCNGWTYPWAVTAIAGTHVCLRKVEAPRIWGMFESEEITHYCAAPTVQIGIVNADEAHPLDIHVRAMIAGAPPSPTLLSQLSELNIDPVHIYGLTETYGPITTSAPRKEWDNLPSDERAALMARQGQAYVTADLARVVEDNQDITQGDGSMGEIAFHGNMVMKGYLDNEEATAEAFDGGWYHTGDVALWHDDGYIEIRDRSKDVIISGGENISTIEVEQAIAKHDAVLEAAVVAIPDEKWGERPKAFVMLKKGKEATEEEIISFCKEKIARYKAPAAVDFVDELPKTSTGKIQKYVLREKEWSGREKQVN